MTIPDDITAICRDFGIDPAIIAAVDHAEGNLLKAVRCSRPSVVDRAEAIRVTCQSFLHARYDFEFKAGGGTPAQFVAYWAARWAPVGATNDPSGLNRNWPKNVLALWRPDIVSVFH